MHRLRIKTTKERKISHQEKFLEERTLTQKGRSQIKDIGNRPDNCVIGFRRISPFIRVLSTYRYIRNEIVGRNRTHE